MEGQNINGGPTSPGLGNWVESDRVESACIWRATNHHGLQNQQVPPRAIPPEEFLRSEGRRANTHALTAQPGGTAVKAR